MTQRSPVPKGKSHYARHTAGAEETKQAYLAEYLVARYASKPNRTARRIPEAMVVRFYDETPTRGKIVRADALDFLRSLEGESADLVFLDPPFNLGKSYSKADPHNDTLPTGQYRDWMTDVLAESARIMRRGATLYLYHLPLWAMRFGPILERFLDFRQWIAISMKNGLGPSNRLYPAHYALLCFSKGRPQTFKRPKVQPATCPHCQKWVKDYGGYKHYILKKGVNLSDVWEDLSPVRHAKRKSRSANELPPLLFERVMTMSAIKNGLYVDPFAGSGSGVIAAIHSRMRFVAGDIVLANCKLLQSRVSRLRLSPRGGPPR